MMIHPSAHPSPTRSRRPDRRTGHICNACGHLFAARPGDHLGAIFCTPCLESEDEPVTAEAYWDLGGGD